GDAVNLQDELNRSDLNDITGVQHGFLNALAVDESAVGTAQVFNADGVSLFDQPAMFAGNITDGNSQIAIFASTDDGHVTGDGKTAAFSVTAEHYQHNLHNKAPLTGGMTAKNGAVE